MPKQKKIAIGALVVFCLAVGMYLLYSQPFKASQPPNNVIGNAAGSVGIIDMKAAMQAHPQYQTLLKLRKERNALSVEPEKNITLAMPLTEPNLDNAAAADALRQQHNQAAAAKLQEINMALQQKQREIIQANAPEYEERLKAIEEQYLPDIFNLQLKLDTLALSQETAQQIHQQIMAKKQAQAEQSNLVQQELRKKVAALMQNEQEKARQQMDQYMAELDNKAKTDSQTKIAAAKERNNLAAAAKNNELKLGMNQQKQDKGSLADKEQEITILEDKIIQDISTLVAKIAAEEKLDTVLTGVEVNVKALDITEQVKAAFKNA